MKTTKNDQKRASGGPDLDLDPQLPLGTRWELVGTVEQPRLGTGRSTSTSKYPSEHPQNPSRTPPEPLQDPPKRVQNRPKLAQNDHLGQDRRSRRQNRPLCGVRSGCSWGGQSDTSSLYMLFRDLCERARLCKRQNGVFDVLSLLYSCHETLVYNLRALSATSAWEE